MTLTRAERIHHIVRLVYCLALLILGMLVAIPVGKTAVSDYRGSCLIDAQVQAVPNCDQRCQQGSSVCAGTTGTCLGVNATARCSVTCLTLTDGSVHVCAYVLFCGVVTCILSATITVVTLLLWLRAKPAITTLLLTCIVCTLMAVFFIPAVVLLFVGNDRFCSSLSNTPGNSCGDDIVGYFLRNAPPINYSTNMTIARSGALVGLGIWISFAVNQAITLYKQRKGDQRQYARQRNEAMSYALAADGESSS